MVPAKLCILGVKSLYSFEHFRVMKKDLVQNLKLSFIVNLLEHQTHSDHKLIVGIIGIKHVFYALTWVVFNYPEGSSRC